MATKHELINIEFQRIWIIQLSLDHAVADELNNGVYKPAGKQMRFPVSRLNPLTVVGQLIVPAHSADVAR